jgi:hypothetical protein
MRRVQRDARSDAWDVDAPPFGPALHLPGQPLGGIPWQDRCVNDFPRGRQQETFGVARIAVPCAAGQQILIGMTGGVGSQIHWDKVQTHQSSKRF